MLTAAGTGFVINDRRGLVALPADRTYQLWGVVGAKVISLGLLGPRPRASCPSAWPASPPVSAFAITDEVAGGVVASANRPVAEGTVAGLIRPRRPRSGGRSPRRGGGRGSDAVDLAQAGPGEVGQLGGQA